MGMPTTERKSAPPPLSCACEEISSSGRCAAADAPQAAPVEIGGPGGPEPTRFGDWEKNGRCIDF